MSDIFIAGGGLAGAAAATILAQSGRRVVLAERESGPTHKVCGEFVSGEARAYLAALGLNIQGARITHVRLVRGRHHVTARLPFEGVGLTRRALDEALLRHAEAAGADIRRGCAVRHIAADLMVSLDGGETLRPSHVLLATGKHEVRGMARAAAPGELVGFKTYFRLDPVQGAELARHVELMVFPGGYAGLQLVEDGGANLSLLVSRAMLRRAGGQWPGLLETLLRTCPHLAARLFGARALLAAPLAIARIPYGFIHRPGAGDPGNLFRLGDQAAVIESFTGDGMSIALHSAALAARTLLAGGTGPSYHARLAHDVSGQLRRAGAMHRVLSAPFLGAAAFAAARAAPPALAAAAALTRLPQSVRLAD